MNVSYNVTVGKVVKRLLKDINLRINEGDMCAVMGPSGAGKRFFNIFRRRYY
jgi:ABC-type lipoprotein export system ATPase subunit